MRKNSAAAIGAACLGVFVVSGCARNETVSGQVIDLACYTRNVANTGLDHDRARACAVACTKWEGQPIGILSSDGKVYQVAGDLAANNNAAVVPYLARVVSITGKITEQDGMMMIAGNQVDTSK